MNPQVQEYVKQAIRSLRYAQLECQIGNQPNPPMAKTLGDMSDSLINTLIPQPPKADDPSDPTTGSSATPSDVQHAKNPSY